MLTGKIIKITWPGQWHVQIEGVRKVFNSFDDMNMWLVYISERVRDPAKKKLLLRDMALIIK